MTRPATEIGQLDDTCPSTPEQATYEHGETCDREACRYLLEQKIASDAAAPSAAWPMPQPAAQAPAGSLYVPLPPDAAEVRRQRVEYEADLLRVRAEARALVESELRPVGSTMTLTDGEEFLFGETADDSPLWGCAPVSLWSPGEGLMIVGPPGVGKSTLAHLVTFGRLGLIGDVLGYPVRDDGGKVLYLAMDRPRQIKRAMRRLAGRVDAGGRVTLKERLIVQFGPLPYLLGDVASRELLARFAAGHGVTTIVIDSVKDTLAGESDEQQAGAYNLARQTCLAQGVEWIELHHNRKASADNKAPKSLDDVYGSRKLTSGAGSVLSLWGEAGDVLVELTQIKSPMEQQLPLSLVLDTAAGTVERHEDAPDLDSIVKATGDSGITPRAAAEKVYGTKKPSKAQVENIRTRLKRAAGRGEALAVTSPFDGSLSYRSLTLMTGAHVST